MAIFPVDALKSFKMELQNNNVVAAPAEGVYGYCANPFSEVALQKLLVLKERAPNKGFILLIHTFEALTQVAAPLLKEEKALLKKHWPGQVTFILPAKEGLSTLLTGNRGTVAVRLPQKEYMQAYLKAWGGPLVSTSANISGEVPIQNVEDLAPGIFKLVAPEALTGGVSKIIDIKTGKVLR